jgi:hypothetical protein
MPEPPAAEYHARAGAYRLLVAQAALALTGDPKAPSVHSQCLDETMADEHLRDIITCLAAMAFGGYVDRESGDVKAAVATIVRELRAAEDLAGLDDE